jgi:hypothetical protein
MKTCHWLWLPCLLLMLSCNQKKRWEVELEKQKVDLKFTDISKDFFDESVSLQTLQSKYPFFFDNSADSVWEKQRAEKQEIAVYDTIRKVFSKSDYQSGLEKMFAYYRFHFPKALLPQVYTYSSGLQSVYEPVIYGKKEGMLFIALDGFLGSESSFYKKERIYPYMAKNMNPENLLPSVVQAIGKEIIPYNPRQQSFVDVMVDEGKKLVLADALLTDTPDELKIGYTKQELEWAKENEGNVWNYFVEQNMVFDSDKSLKERFIQPAPFSKFLNEIETESPGRMGIYIGWQICRKYLDENPEMSLEEFINKDTQEIFKNSKYKPKKGDADYSQTKKEKNDEVEKYE